MNSANRKRVLIVSGAIILLCMVIIVRMTFALFTDSERMSNHLRAGDLEVALARTYLEYSVLDANGKLAVTKNDKTVSFTGSTKKNVFGVDAEGIYIVPGSYFKAKMKVSNVGNVAFTYHVGIQLTGEVNALARQLEVVVTRADGSTVTATLSEMANGFTIQAGELLKDADAQEFTVEVRFIDNTFINNAAQTQLSVFDLYVSAVQATGAPKSDKFQGASWCQLGGMAH